MSRINPKSAAARSALGVFGLLAVAACTNSIAATSGELVSKSDGPLTCTIEQTRQNGMIRLQAVVSATSELSGEYRFSVRGGGANINQGGPFMASPNSDTTVGVIQLSTGAYTIELDVDAGSRSVACKDSVRLSI